MKQLLIAVDFDDTIAQNTCYPEVGEPVEWALQGLSELTAAGHRIQIWTCRHGQALENAKTWLDAHGVAYERINENCPVLIGQWGETRKMSADVYIDDKTVGGMPRWYNIPDLVNDRATELWEQENAARLVKHPQLIGLSGRRGSGKNTVATIARSLNRMYSELSFADSLKNIAAQLTGESISLMYSQDGKRKHLPAWGMTIGELLQRLGTDAIRNGLHDQAWVLYTFSKITPHGYFIITDCRFPNEVEAIKARGGVVWRVEGDPLKQQGDGTRDDTHPSETALNDYQHFDAVIRNDGTLDDLRQKVLDLLDSYATK